MQEYEFRILDQKRSSSLKIEAFHFSDGEAIKTADRIAFGRAIEVWRDLDCIYRAAGAAQPTHPGS